MDEKKDIFKNIEIIRSNSKIESLKRSLPNFKNSKAKTSLKEIGRSRNQNE